MFDPINKDHAIQSIGFALIFDGPAGESAGRTLRSNRELVSELPALQEPETIEFGIQAGGTPTISAPRRLKGVQLAHLRPDGTPAWALRIVGNELAVDCTRYTRWERIWLSAEKYLTAGMAAVKGANSDRKITAVTLKVLDAFLPNSDDYDLSGLLKSGPLIAGRVFSAGPTWHSHVGWFDRVDAFGRSDQLCLNHVNIDAARVQIDQASQEKQLRIVIAHHQELRAENPLDMPGSEEFAAFMNELHSRNKATLKSLLVRSMAEKIGLETADAQS